MRHGGELPHRDVHAGFGKHFGVGKPLVVEGVVTGDHHEGCGCVGDLPAEYRESRIRAISESWDIVVEEP